MPQVLNIFESVEHLEPRCPRCRVILDYGINTKYSEKAKAHICNGCGASL